MIGTRSEMFKVLESLRQTRNGGRIFRVTFRKRTTGELRTIVCRMGVKPKTPSERGRPYDPRKHALLTVFDMQAREYRNIAIDAIVSARIGGIDYGTIDPQTPRMEPMRPATLRVLSPRVLFG